MSPNSHYLAGRRFEYERKKAWEKDGWSVTRAAGSHSAWDLIAIKPERVVALIQCKYVSSQHSADKLLADFREDPPFIPSIHYHQVLDVRLRGYRTVLQAYV